MDAALAIFFSSLLHCNSCASPNNARAPILRLALQQSRFRCAVEFTENYRRTPFQIG